MKEREGLFTDEQEDFLARVLDDFTKFKNPILEIADGPAYRIVLRTIDNRLLNQIPDDWKIPLIQVIDLVMQREYAQARLAINDIANSKIDIPGMTEETELMFIDGFTKMCAAAIDWYIQRKAA